MELNKFGTDTPNSPDAKDYEARASHLYGGNSTEIMHDTDKVLENYKKALDGVDMSKVDKRNQKDLAAKERATVHPGSPNEQDGPDRHGTM